MANYETVITRTTAELVYCTLYDDSASAYVDYDASALSRDSAAQLMWGETTDYMYWGADASWNGFGFKASVAGSYGALTWEYWNGSTWTSFTPDYDGTAGFTQDGYILFGTLGSWASTSVGGTGYASQAAFWVRASVASVTTPAQFNHFLHNLTVGAAGKLMPTMNDDGDVERDINGDLQNLDRAYTGPVMATVRCRNQASLNMAGVNLLHWFRENRHEVTIEDQAQGATPDPTAHSFFVEYTGRLMNVAENAASVAKMEPNTFEFRFLLDDYTALF